MDARSPGSSPSPSSALPSSPAPAASDEPIIIVGAGPVGLAAALGLASFGVPSLVLDEDESTAIEGSRAIFIERHTLEILGAWSEVGRQMAEQGMTLLAGRVFFRTREIYKTFNAPPDPNIRYPRFVNFPQNTMERLEYEAVAAQPLCEVRWRHRVTAVAQDEAGVTLTAETPDGPRTLHSPYVLACDGAHSTMRRLLDLPFPGEKRDHHFLILDVRMRLDTPRERWFWFDPPFNPGRTALLHPQPDSIYRIDYQLAPDEDLDAVKSPESIHRRIVATVGERPYEVVWKSTYAYQQRALSQLSLGRVFFLGDAAHLMSPFGGRGLNSGVQDAWNLPWKLAFVRAGYAPEALLATYHVERHAAALENLRLTADTMRFLTPRPGPARWRRDAILRLSLRWLAMRKRVNAGHMSNPFTYRASPLTSEDRVARLPHVRGRSRKELLAVRASFIEGPLAGALAPELILAPDETDETGETRSLLDLFGRELVVFAFTDDPDATTAALAAVRPRLPALPLALYVIAPRPPATPLPEGIRFLQDADGRCAAAYHALPGTLYVMRPDRHIAARRLASDPAELPALLSQAIGGTVAPPGSSSTQSSASAAGRPGLRSDKDPG